MTFHCATHGAPLVTSCPVPYTFRANAAGQSARTRTIQSTDGGTASVTKGGINLDRSPPSVSVGRIRGHAVYEAAPAARCVARDSLSGIASCVNSGCTTATGPPPSPPSLRDKPGNTRSTHVSYTTLPIAVGDAPFTDGAFSVKAGHAYTLVMRGSATRPIYYDAAIYPSKPVIKANAFYAGGHRRWVLGVAIDENMRSHTYWNLASRSVRPPGDQNPCHVTRSRQNQDHRRDAPPHQTKEILAVPHDRRTLLWWWRSRRSVTAAGP